MANTIRWFIHKVDTKTVNGLQDAVTSVSWEATIQSEDFTVENIDKVTFLPTPSADNFTDFLELDFDDVIGFVQTAEGGKQAIIEELQLKLQSAMNPTPEEVMRKYGVDPEATSYNEKTLPWNMGCCDEDETLVTNTKDETI